MNFPILKSTLFIFCLCLFSISLFAQEDERVAAAIYPFDYNVGSMVDKKYVASVNQIVASAFQQHGRFNLVDRTNISALEMEKELARGIEFMEGQTLAQKEAVGAKYIITGTIDKLAVDHKVSKEGTATYKANVSFLLKVTKTETGEIVASEQISSDNRLGAMVNLSMADTEEKAVENALRKFDKKLSKFINDNFKGAGVYVVETMEEGGSAAKKVLISGGSNMGFKKGMKLIVFIPTIKKIGGKTKTWEKQLGELKIDSVEDETFSICTVKSGGAKILSGLQNEEELQVKVKPGAKLPSFIK